MRLIKGVIVIVMVAALGLAVADQSASPAFAATPGTWTVDSLATSGCDAFDTVFNVSYSDIDPAEDYYQETIVSDGTDVYMDELVGPTTPFDTTWALYDSDDRGLQTASFPIPSPVTVVFTLHDSTMTPIYRTTLSYDCSGGSYVILSSGPVGTSTTAEPVPGPDMVPIPDHAVVGAVLTDTVVYFAPQADAATDIVIEAGKTYWVYGMDESRAYYKVMMSGRFFWLPAATMGPNYDEVWNGTPLPTVVVD